MKHTIIRFMAATIFCLMQVMFPLATASAQQSKKVYAIHDEESFQELTVPTTFMPPGKPELEFTINVPKDWTTESNMDDNMSSVGKKLVGDLVTFESPLLGIYTLKMHVQTIGLEEEIDADSWLQNYLLANGYAKDGEDIPSDSPYKAASYYTYVHDGKSTFAYIRVHFSGTVALLWRFEMPLKLRHYASFVQRRLIDSAKMSFERNEPVEQGISYTVADAIKFSYPMSWEIAASNFKNTDKLSTHLVNKNNDGLIQGYVGLMATRRNGKTNFKSALQEVRGYFNDTMNLEIEEMISSKPGKKMDRFIFNRDELYMVQGRRKHQAQQELRIRVLGDENWYIFIFLITPKKVDTLKTWARNTRTFEVILNTLR